MSKLIEIVLEHPFASFPQKESDWELCKERMKDCLRNVVELLNLVQEQQLKIERLSKLLETKDDINS